MPANEKKLRLVLMANAAFSCLSGLSISLSRVALARLMGIANSSVLIWVGIGLIGFSITVFITARRKVVSNKQVKSIIVQDWAWVAGSALIIGLQAWKLTNTAYWLIGIIALLVADFAIFQARYLKKLA